MEYIKGKITITEVEKLLIALKDRKVSLPNNINSPILTESLQALIAEHRLIVK